MLGTYPSIKNGKKHCNKCDKDLSLDCFARRENPVNGSGYHSYCRKCEVVISKEYRRTNRVAVKRTLKVSEWKTVYGLTENQYNDILTEQSGGCAICGQTYSYIRNGERIGLCVDHDSVSGAVRGLLCSKCNIGIGSLEHNIELIAKAIRYLERRKDYRNGE